MTTQESSVVTTQSLQMIRGSVDLRSFQSWAGSRQLMSRQTFDAGYAMHCFLAGVFGELAPQPFRLILPRSRGNRQGVFYGYGRADADALRGAAAQFADPLQGPRAAQLQPGWQADAHGVEGGYTAGIRASHPPHGTPGAWKRESGR